MMGALTRHEGVAAGFRSGLLVAALASMKAAADGSGVSYPAKLVAGLWYGTPALVRGLPTAAGGLAAHLAFSAALGALFVAAAPARRLTGARAWAAGLVYGLALWALMTFAGLPVLNRTMSARVALTPFWWLTLHLAFGSALVWWRPGVTSPEPCSGEGSVAER